MLAIVEDEQQAALTQFGDEGIDPLLARTIAHAEGGGDRVRDARDPGGPDEIDEPDVVGEGRTERERALEGQPGLAHAARPDECDQTAACPSSQQARDGALAARTTDEGGAGGGEIVCGGANGCPCADRQRQERRARRAAEIERGRQSLQRAVLRHDTGPRFP